MAISDEHLVTLDSIRKPYRKKHSALIIAVQLDLDTPGFTYQKWGATQRCRRGDWLVNNQGDFYTVAQDSFARTYVAVSPGIYQKITNVWAKPAAEAGSITTREGLTHFRQGDYLVCNEEQSTDVYAVERAVFEAFYDEIKEND